MISRRRVRERQAVVEDGLTLNIDQLVKARFLIPGSRMSGRIDWSLTAWVSLPDPFGTSPSSHYRMLTYGFTSRFGIRSAAKAIR